MLLSGEAESIGDKKGKFHAQDSHENALLSETVAIPSQQEAIIRIGKLLADSKMPAPAAIGHRIVHGGPKLRQHCLIDDPVVRQLEAATAFAPLYTPAALSVIRFAQEHFPGLPQVACFDTTFHTLVGVRRGRFTRSKIAINDLIVGVARQAAADRAFGADDLFAFASDQHAAVLSI